MTAIGPVHDADDPGYCKIMDCFGTPKLEFDGYCSSRCQKLDERLDMLMGRKVMPKKVYSLNGVETRYGPNDIGSMIRWMEDGEEITVKCRYE